jgi:parvulin-like peptidyl-prolyl isomerase
MDIVKIDGKGLSCEDFVIWLKLSGRFSQVIEDYVKEKVSAVAARKAGMVADADELQVRADESRRALGLHRASETNAFLDDAGATLDDFEAYLEDQLLAGKMRGQVQSDDAVEGFFRLHSPKYDAIEVSHMVIDGESQANEIVSLLADAEATFEELAAEHSVSDSAPQGGRIGLVYRGQLGPDLEAKIFNAAVGDPLGPFDTGDGRHFEIFVVNARQMAALEGATRAMIEKQLFEEWLEAQARALQVQA